MVSEELILREWYSKTWLWVKNEDLIFALNLLKEKQASPYGYILKNTADGWFIYKMY